jgi:arylsulfatase A-like enzyme
MVTSSAGKLCRPLPNVLLIVTDDQRADTVVGSAAENPIAQLAMPQTRKWFRDGAPGAPGGTEFPNGFVTTPWCCPSRASIFSGQYAHNHNVRTLDPVELDGYAPKLQFSIQRYLRDWWGYRTALFGKFLNSWTFRFDPRVATPPETYFDEYEMINGAYKSGGITFPRPCAGPPMTSHSCIVKKDANGDLAVFEQEQYTTHRFADSAKQFIEAQDAANDGQPWFMQVSPWAPHEEGETWGPNAWSKMTNGSLHAGKPIPALSPGPGHNEPDRWDKPGWVRGDGDTNLGWSDAKSIFEKEIDGTTYPGLREQQLRALGDVDDMVEQIFDTLEAKGEADNTIAFFISDNGYMWREHSPDPIGIPNECYTDIAATPPQDQVACGLSNKARPYREAINVPFFVRWPNSPWTLPAVDSRLVANVDLAPTVLDAVGGLDLPLEQPMDGRSLFRSGQRARLLVEGWGAGLPDWASVVEPTKQYIFTDSDADPDTNDPQWQELYDYPGDGQNLNLFGTDGTPNGGEPMRPPAGLLDAWRQCVGSACP